MTAYELETAIAAAKAGNEEGYRQLFAEFSGMIYSLVSRILPDEADAEELTQDVFLQAFAALADFQPQGGGFAAWLRRIAYNMSISRLRNSGPKMISIDNKEISESIGDLETFESKDDAIMDLMEAIKKLPKEEQALLQMFYFDHLSMQEIAYVVSSKPTSVAMRMSRIRKKLKRLFSKEQ